MGDEPFEMPQPGPGGNATLIFVIGVLLLWSSWSGSGRAPGMAVLGLRVVNRDGGRLSSRRAFWRAVLAVADLRARGDRRGLQQDATGPLYDMICGSAVVYDWRPALPESRQNQ